MLRKLRIAFSVACGILCLLLIALWVRSYSHLDMLEKMTSSRTFQVSSRTGRFAFHYVNPDRNPRIRATGVALDLLKELSLGRATYSAPVSETVPFHGDDGAGFGHFNQSISMTVFAPHWFPILLMATCAAVPWVTWARRFSLRTLLIATTLVAVVLGLVVALR